MTTISWYNTIGDARSYVGGGNYSWTLNYLDAQAHSAGLEHAIGFIFEIDETEIENPSNAFIRIFFQSESNADTIPGFWKIVPNISSWVTGTGNSPGGVYSGSGLGTVADALPSSTNDTPHSSPDLGTLLAAAIPSVTFSGGTGHIAVIFQSSTTAVSGGSPRWKRYDSLETASGNPAQFQYDFAPSAIAIDGKSTSSSDLKIRDTYNVGRWYGADAVGASSVLGSAIDGIVGQITSGRWDIPPSRVRGAEIVDIGYEGLSRATLTGAYNVRRSSDRKVIQFSNEFLGGYNGVFWDMWKHHPTKTSTDTFDVWSTRFYIRPSVPFGMDCYWFQAYDTNLGLGTGNGTKVLIYSGGTADSYRLSTWDDTGYNITGGYASTWNRVEIQASEYLDPKLTIRIYNDNSTTPTITHTENPTSISVNSLLFGAKTDVLNFFLADLEIWDDFNLGGEFPSTPGVTTGGSPYTEPTQEWFYYDGASLYELDDEGTVRALESGVPKFDTDVLALTSLDWHSDITGTGSFNPGVGDAFSSSGATGDATITYETATPNPPAGISKYLEHTVTSDDGDAVIDTGVDEESLYFRFYYNYSVAGTGDATAIFQAKDSSSNVIFSITTTSNGWVQWRNEEVVAGSETLFYPTPGAWYRFEFFYNSNASVAESEPELILRVFEDSDPDALFYSQAFSVTTNITPVRYLSFGPSSVLGSQFTSFTCYTAGHAYDTVGWIGGATDGYSHEVDGITEDLTVGSLRNTSQTYKPLTYAAIGSVPTPYADISYGIGTGDTGLRKLDIHLPPGTPPSEGWPAVVWVHGGSWAGGSRTEYRDFKDICLAGGYAFISIGYQLSEGGNIFGTADPPAYSLNGANAGRMPTFILDVKQALHWIKNNAGDSPYNINLNAIAGSAYSAGCYNMANAVYSRGLTSDASSWNWTLAANGATAHPQTGNSYYYDDEGQGDPDIIKCIYMFAPPVSPYLLYTYEDDEGPGIFMPNRSGGIGYTTVRNMYANNASWETWAASHEMYDFIVSNPSAVVPTCGVFGSADWFVTNDWHNQTGGYGQMPRLQQAFDDAVGLPANAELDIYVNGMNHDYVMDDINIDHFYGFLRGHL